MQSTQQSRKRPSKQPAKKGQANGDTLVSPAFQEKVERLDRLMKAAAATPAAPPGFTLVRREGEGGTLEQVGREADNAWSGVKRIMQLLNVEGKAFDTQTSFTNGYAGNYLNCSNIAQGVGDNQRTGDSLRVTRLRAKFQISYATASTTVICVVGRSKDGSPAIADIFDTIGTAYSGISYENHDQRKADQILAWKAVVIDNVQNPLRVVKFDLKNLPDTPTTFSNGTTTQTANCYWAAMICGVVSGPTVVFNARADFVDN